MLERSSSKCWEYCCFPILCWNPRSICLAIEKWDWMIWYLNQQLYENAFAWTLPEFDGVHITMIEELSKLWKNKGRLLLKHMQRRIEYFPSDMNGVCDNNDFWYFMREGRVINTTSQSKEFGFWWSNIDNIVENFDHRLVANMNVRYERGDIVFDTHISYHKSSGWGGGGFNCWGIELLKTRFKGRIILSTKSIERETIRKGIDNSVTGLKFRVNRVKSREDFIKPVIYIDYVAF